MEHSLSITRKMHRYARKIFFTDFMSAELTGTLLLAICWYFIGIFTGGILSGDETRVAGIAAEMSLENDWITPRLNGRPFLEFPPLFYQLTALSYRAFGINDPAAKLPAALAAIGTVLLVFAAMRILKRPPMLALLASFLLMSSMQFFANARTCRADMLLTFFTTLAGCGFLQMTESRKRGGAFAGWLLLAAGIAGGLLTKGLVGAALPAAGIGGWLLGDALCRRHFPWRLWLATAAAFLAALLPLAGYLWLLYREGGPDTLHKMFYVNGIGRFSGSQGDHLHPWYGYLLKLPEQFCPWLPLVFLGGWCVWRGRRQRRNAGMFFVVSMLVLPFVLLSCAASKRNIYLLPLAPWCALLAAEACRLVAFRIRDRRTGRWLARQRRKLVSWLNVGLLLGICVHLVTIPILIRIEKEESLRQLFEEADRMATSEGRRIVLIRPPERLDGAAVFYLRRRVERAAPHPVSPDGREVWIARRPKFRHAGWELGDHHVLIRAPEELLTSFKGKK